jgi:hypothetical protein
MRVLVGRTLTASIVYASPRKEIALAFACEVEWSCVPRRGACADGECSKIHAYVPHSKMPHNL